jgi:hypothetical protein
MSADQTGPLVRAALAIEPLNETARRCQKIYLATLSNALNEGRKPAEARQLAAAAYRLAMPALVDRAGIQDSIACTAQGLVLRVFTGQEASSLLYAAQVAISLAKQENQPCQRRPGRPRTTKPTPRPVRSSKSAPTPPNA